MQFNAKAAAKVGSVLGLSGIGITGIYLSRDYLNNSISKYESALIGFLKADEDNDIVFTVNKKDETMITASGDSQDSISAKIQVSNGNNTAFKNGKSNPKNKGMENIEGVGKTWTWECAFNFRKEVGAAKNTIKDKAKIIGNDGEGLFGILKQDISTYTKDENKSMAKESEDGIY